MRAPALVVGGSLAAAYAYKNLVADVSFSQPALAQASTADRIRGNYENKIRFFSPPEKIFEVFATKQFEDGSLVMTYADFIRAMIPYNNEKVKSNAQIELYLEWYGNDIKELLKLADPDGDKEIAFTEFLMFTTIMQIPETTMSRLFFGKFEGNKMTEE